MTRASLLPEVLRRRPFTVAEARVLGVTPDVLAGAQLRSPHRGVRVPVALPDTLAVRCLAAQLVLPHRAAFAGVTGLELCRVPLPLWVNSSRMLHIVVPPGHIPRVDGVTAQKSRFTHDQRLVAVEEVPGVSVRVLLPAHAWADLAPGLPRHDAVALGDAVLRRWSSQAHLDRVVAAREKTRGVRVLREVLPLLRPSVDSWWESVTRMLVVDAGLPEPAVNRDVSADGGWLSRPDLSWPAVKVAVEYDGDHHRERRQWRHDRARRRVMRQHGWIVIELTADDVRHTPQHVVTEIAEALRERGLTW